MKKYPTFDERKKNQDLQRTCEELKLFQCLLRNSDTLNDRYHGKAEAIADGLQPWIDALEISSVK